MISIKEGDKVLVESSGSTAYAKRYYVGTVISFTEKQMIWKMAELYDWMEEKPIRRSREGVVKVLSPDTDLRKAVLRLHNLREACEAAIRSVNERLHISAMAVDEELGA